MKKRCRTCMHWRVPDGRDQWNIINPLDPDTYKPMEMSFSVRECVHPKLLFCERPVTSDGFAVADGSEYMAVLYTAEDFGCVKWEKA